MSQQPTNIYTTISVETSVRDMINQEARRLRLSQREMVALLLKVYRQKSDNNPDVKARGDPEAGRIMSFIREQEKLFLKPTLTAVLSIESLQQELITLLKDAL